jgi:hypothetical protein
MNTRRAVLVLAATVILSTALFAQPSESSSESPEAFLARFITALDNLDWDAMKQFFDPNATMFFPTTVPHRVEGATELEQRWQVVLKKLREDSGKAARPYMDVQPRRIKTQMIGPNAAVITFEIEYGSEKRLGRRTFVLHRARKGWLIDHLHASSVDLE